ncbi:MAG: hypothetical protein AB7K63_07365 [Vicinamibacterales bacterium]
MRSVRGTAFARLVSWTLRKEMISCGRCGWQGRVELRSRHNAQGSRRKSHRAGRVEPVLAEEITLELPPLNVEGGGTNLPQPPRDDIDLAALDRALSNK